MTTTALPPPLWEFALAFYAHPQIAQTCVHLQDNYKVNVCLLIALRWLDELGKCLSDAQLAALQAHIQIWAQQVVEPLRSLRRLLKQPVAAYPQDETQAQIRTAIKRAELLAEKKLLLDIEVWLQQLIYTQCAPIKSNFDKSNLDVYLSELAVGHDVIELLQRKFYLDSITASG